MLSSNIPSNRSLEEELGSRLPHNIPFKLFSNCICVDGHSRSIIIDMQRENYYLIPKALSQILRIYNGKTISEIIQNYSETFIKNLLPYFHFLLNNELIFFNKRPELFSEIALNKWKFPVEVYQAIIDVDKNDSHLNKELFNDLNSLNCKYLQLRFYSHYNVSKLQKLLRMLEGTSIVGVELYIRYKSQKITNEIINKLKFHLRINLLVIHSSIKKTIVKSKKNYPFTIIHTNQIIASNLNCGVVSKEYFSLNISSVTKSMNMNNCLAGKISVDVYGEIKNCPSCKISFGNIKNTTILDALKIKSFKSIWAVTKDKISVCKDCEFRYVCTDCRAFIENPNDIYSKPLKCGYDPYKGVWEKWSTNPLKQTVIEYYKLNNW